MKALKYSEDYALLFKQVVQSIINHFRNNENGFYKFDKPGTSVIYPGHTLTGILVSDGDYYLVTCDDSNISTETHVEDHDCVPDLIYALDQIEESKYIFKG